MSARGYLDGHTMRNAGATRRLVAWWVLGSALVLGLVASLFLGSTALSAESVWAALTGAPVANRADIAVVLELRVPRTVLACVVGACLGVAGGIMQVHTRNPMADPGLLGVTAGAGFGVVAAIVWFGAQAPAQYALWALLGAAVAGTLVLGLAARVRSFEPVTALVVTGAVTSALLGASTTALVLVNNDAARAFQGWAAGTLVDRPLSLLVAVAPLLVGGVIAALANLSSWRGSLLGSDVAAGLGRHVARDRLVGGAAVVLLAAAATAVAGSVAFVGLLAPHVCRWAWGYSPVATVLGAAPVGAVLVLFGDVIGRISSPSGELPVGVALAVIGAPVFVFLARRWNR